MGAPMQPPKARLKIPHILRVTCCRMTRRFCNWQATESMRSWCEPLSGFSISTATKSPLTTVLDAVGWPRRRKPDNVVSATTTGTRPLRQTPGLSRNRTSPLADFLLSLVFSSVHLQTARPQSGVHLHTPRNRLGLSSTYERKLHDSEE